MNKEFKNILFKLSVLSVSFLIISMYPGETPISSRWEFNHQVAVSDLGRSDDIKHADFDKDGDNDLVVGDGPRLSWVENKGGDFPKWHKHIIISSDDIKDYKGEKGWMGVWTGDFDGDIDICGSSKGSFDNLDNPTVWFENNLESKGWNMHYLPVTGGIVDNSRVYDFNNDGRDDIIIEHYFGSGVYYCPSPSNPKGTWRIYKIGEGRDGLSLADCDNDGDMDVIVDNTWLENPGNPATDNWKSHTVPESESGVKNAGDDLNGDNLTDFVFAKEEGSGVWVHLAPSYKKQTLLNEGNGLHTMRLEDLDKDGDLDIITAQIHASDPNVYIFENNGTGRNWNKHYLQEGDDDGTHNAWTGDLNGDNMPDIYGKHFTGENLDIWYNLIKEERAMSHLNDNPVFE